MGANGHGAGDTRAAKRPPGPKTAQVFAHDQQDVKKRDRVLDDYMARAIDDYTAFTLDEAPNKATVPGLFISNTSQDEWAQIVKHFDLSPIVYPDERDYFVAVDLETRTLQKTVGEKAIRELQARYAPNGIGFSKRKLWATPLFAGAADLAASTYAIPRESVNLMILAPPQVMAYLAWKSVKALKDRGLDPATVRACHARFDQLSDGGWVLTVTDIVMKDGKVHRVGT